MSSLGRLLKKIVWSRRVFDFWQRLGVNVTRKHYYSPIPDTRELDRKADLWTRESSLVGLDLRLDEQLRFLNEVCATYQSEFDFPVDRTDVPHEYYFNNAEFGLVDGLVLYSMIRHFQPRTVIEIGSGNSTMMAARACLKNKQEQHDSKLISIEPYPRTFIKNGFPGLDSHVTSKVEEMDLAFFDRLRENDILFIDTSHVLRTGNDVCYLYLELLARLKKGVVIHIHDIFLPYEYPRQWVVQNRVFWTEQYLLQAFLCHNRFFEVLFANYCMTKKHGAEMQSVFAAPPGYRERNLSNSFWIRKTGT